MRIIKMLKQPFLISILLFVVCGVVYPLALTGVSQVMFNHKANGSIIELAGEKRGSEVIGQHFTDSRFFKGRISAVGYNTYTEEDLIPDAEGNTAYGGVASGSQNLAPSNPALTERVKKDMETFLQNNPTVKQEDVPADLLTASGSGLDPHISLAAAKVQIQGIAQATGISEEEIQQMVDRNTTKKLFGVLGEETVNVLKTNIEIAEKLGISELKE